MKATIFMSLRPIVSDTNSNAQLNFLRKCVVRNSFWLLLYCIYRRCMNGWKMQVRDNYQNFIRALNKQIVYAEEGLIWSGSLSDVENNCHWGLSEKKAD